MSLNAPCWHGTPWYGHAYTVSTKKLQLNGVPLRDPYAGTRHPSMLNVSFMPLHATIQTLWLGKHLLILRARDNANDPNSSPCA